MRGWLMVNSFLDTAKFAELYALLLAAAERRGIGLALMTGSDVTAVMGEGLAQEALPDFVLFWDKDVVLAQTLEQAGVRVLNSADAIACCDNKALTCLRLAAAGVAIPKTVSVPKTFEGVGYTHTDFLAGAVRALGLPLVIKECYGSFGQQVYLAHTEEEAGQILARVGHKDCIMQEFIASSYGRDLRIQVVGGRVVSTMLRRNDGDFRSNITNGGGMYPYTPTAAQMAAAVDAAAALGLDFAGVDVLFGPNDAPLVCEVNSNPHFKSTLDCTGVDLAEHIMDYLVRQWV